jgi:hypothetical protein
LLIEAAIALTYIYVYYNAYLFTAYISISFYINGTVYVAMPIYYAGVFGPEIGSQAYGYFFSANAFGNLFLSVLVNLL